MTSEILIMTPSAIAMAADSVVTVNNNKTFEGVNKLFMLSNDPPFGIMTYNNANFFNIPIETIIKDFRNYLKDKEKDEIKKFPEHLEKYLTEIIEKTTIHFPEKGFINIFFEEIEKRLTNENKEIFIKSIQKELFTKDETFEKIKMKFLKNNDNEKYFEEKIEKLIQNQSSEVKERMKDLFIKELMEYNIGIVIAGFEKDNLFPSYILLNIYPITEKEFEIITLEKKDIGDAGVIVKPLAQTDVILNFINGIDEYIYTEILNYVETLIHNYTNNFEKLIKENKKINGKDENVALSIVKTIRNNEEKTIKNFIDFLNEINRNNMDPILQSIMSLPKEELSNLAESLINITSLKRKVQSNLETVGGDVDVAIITKGDGFIWTKRKHYFKRELNPQFFNRT